MYQNIYYDRTKNTIYLFDDENGIAKFKYEPYAYRLDPMGSHKALDGNLVTKVTRFKPNDKNLYESDIPAETRTLIDVYGDDNSSSKNHCILNFDIETAMDGGYGTTINSWQPIISIAFMDSVSNIRRVYVIDEEDEVEDSDFEGSRGRVIVKTFLNEEELLKNFISEFRDINPTIITGWNICGYDIPYLCNRIDTVFGANSKKALSPIGIVKLSSKDDNDGGRFDCTIAGVSCLDYYDLYRIFTYTQLPNYRLDTVGRKEVDMGKIEYDGTLNTLFKSDINKFVDYNLTDIDIVDALDKKMKLIELVRDICHICHVPYENIRFSSKYLEGALLTYLRIKGLVANTRPVKLDLGENDKFLGAFVKQPVPGFYKWIFSNDLASLYPSIIRTLNISPETKVGKVVNWDSVRRNFYRDFDRIKDNSILKVIHENDQLEMDKDEFVKFIKDKNYSLSSCGVMYRQDIRGIIPEILDVWYQQRKEFQKMMNEASNAGDAEKETYYDRRQLIQKVFLNSMYGVLGLNGWRWYDLDNAVSVTATGQEIIKATSDRGNKVYSELLIKCGKNEEDVSNIDYVTYIDTDSNYISNEPLIKAMGIEDDEKCKLLTIKTSNHLVDNINKYYDDLMFTAFNVNNHVIKTEGETVGRRAVWIAKKRYAIHKIYDLGKHKDVDKFHIKGLDVVRSSFPTKFKNFMLNEETTPPSGIISDILHDLDKKKIDQDILDFKRQLSSFNVVEVARNTSVKDLSRFEDYCRAEGQIRFGYFPKVKNEEGRTIAFPVHVKAAINFNTFIKHHKLDKNVESIFNGEKIKYVYLKPNNFGITEIAFRGYQDPDELTEFINKYADAKSLYENELSKKLDDFYDALKWEYPSEGDKIIDSFFGEEDEAPIRISTEKPKKEKIKVKEENEFFEF